tara:strand:+ start:186 stop:857 length:672 start_codon:yes stop_codon:yes gene_type:complete
MMAAAGAQAFVLNITANTSDYNILTQATALGYNNSVAADIVVNVASGVTVSGSSTYAMRTGGLHNDTNLTINITGSVDGYTGANGGTGAVGAVGGDAVYWETDTDGTGVYIINLTGNLRGGGGGGGGGGRAGVRKTYTDGGKGYFYCDFPQFTGSVGATGSAGAFGVAGTGGNNGTYGGGSALCIVTTIGSGAPGGAAGFALRENSRTITLNNDGGTIAGTVG